MSLIPFRPQVNGPTRLLRTWIGGSLLLCLITGCGKGHETDCLKSTGRVVTERRELAPFYSVTARDNVDVTLVQDSVFYAEVRAGQNLQADLTLTVRDGQLTIGNTSRCNWVRTFNTPREVRLYLPTLTDLFLQGQGNVRTEGQFRTDAIFCHLVGAGDFDLDFDCRYLWADLYELGDVTLRGRADETHLILGGSGTLFAAGLSSRTCNFRSDARSTGSAHVRATEALTGTHAGHGTLYYSGLTGAPTLTGRGNIVRR